MKCKYKFMFSLKKIARKGLTVTLEALFEQTTTKTSSKILHRLVHAKLQYLQCISSGNTAVFHYAINMFVLHRILKPNLDHAEKP